MLACRKPRASALSEHPQSCGSSGGRTYCFASPRHHGRPAWRFLLGARGSGLVVVLCYRSELATFHLVAPPQHPEAHQPVGLTYSKSYTHLDSVAHVKQL